jgi:hypothetical protein
VLNTENPALLLLPNGSTFQAKSTESLQTDSVVTVKYLNIAADTGLPLEAIVSKNSDLSWEDICLQENPYMVNFGVTSRASCRGCKKQLDKYDLRITSTMLHTPGNFILYK